MGKGVFKEEDRLGGREGGNFSHGMLRKVRGRRKLLLYGSEPEPEPANAQ